MVEKSTVILPVTAKVRTKGPFGCCGKRFLLDNGSETTLVSQRFCQRLGLSISRVACFIQGLGGIGQLVRGFANFTVSWRTNKSVSFSVPVLLMGRIICEFKGQFTSGPWFTLADLDFGQTEQLTTYSGPKCFLYLELKHRKGWDRNLMTSETSAQWPVIVWGTARLLLCWLSRWNTWRRNFGRRFR